MKDLRMLYLLKMVKYYKNLYILANFDNIINIITDWKNSGIKILKRFLNKLFRWKTI